MAASTPGPGRRPTETTISSVLRAGARRRMFVKLTLSSLRRRRSRLFIALAAMTVGVAVVAALSSVYLDLRANMTRELRGYGANLVVVPAEGGSLPSAISGDQLQELRLLAEPGSLLGAVPYLHGVVDLAKGVRRARAPLTGTDFGEAVRVNPYWRISGRRPAAPGEALVGVLLARRLQLSAGDQVTVASAARAEAAAGDRSDVLDLEVTGILSTGGSEDERMFLDLSEAQTVLKRADEIGTIHLSILGQGPELQQIAGRIQDRFPQLATRAVSRVAQSEGRVLLRLGVLFYLVVGVVLVTAALGVIITMLTMALERRRELGLKKALGAQNRDLLVELLGEAGLISLVGALLGTAAGFLLAQWIGWSVFGSTVSFRPAIVPVALLVSSAIAGLASLAPIRVAARIDPAVVLKEE